MSSAINHQIWTEEGGGAINGLALFFGGVGDVLPHATSVTHVGPLQ